METQNRKGDQYNAHEKWNVSLKRIKQMRGVMYNTKEKARESAEYMKKKRYNRQYTDPCTETNARNIEKLCSSVPPRRMSVSRNICTSQNQHFFSDSRLNQ